MCGRVEGVRDFLYAKSCLKIFRNIGDSFPLAVVPPEFMKILAGVRGGGFKKITDDLPEYGF